jgi:GntR family transcriptional repressor for pyruvate dehydrogenase complex
LRWGAAIRTPRPFERAFDEIVGGVAGARLRRGDRLPNEAELSEQLGISKPTLRQALRVLERSGMLVVRPGKGGGIFVASELPPHDALSANIDLETEAVVETLRGRRILEGAVVRASVAAATNDDFAELERTVRLLLAHASDHEKVIRADAMYHAALAVATHNRMLADAMRLVSRRLAPLRDLYTSGADEVARIAEIHSRQVKVMRTRELAELEDTLDEHFRMLEEQFALSLGQTWERLFGPDAGRISKPFEPPWRKLASLPDEYHPRGWRSSLQDVT